MTTFKNTNGQSWNIALTFDALKRVKAMTGVELDKPDVGEPVLLERIALDCILLGEIIYAICKPQADELGLGEDDFGKAIDGEVLANIVDAFLEEWINFFHLRRHEYKATVIRKAMAEMRERIAEADTKASSPEFAAEMKETPNTASLSTPTDSPESSG